MSECAERADSETKKEEKKKSGLLKSGLMRLGRKKKDGEGEVKLEMRP